MVAVEQTAAAANGETASMHMVRGDALMAFEKPVEALNAYIDALKLNPEMADAYAAAADIYDMNGHTAHAIESYERYLALRPDAHDAEEISEYLDDLRDMEE